MCRGWRWSARERMALAMFTVIHRIRIRMDPHWYGYPDPDPHRDKKLDPDPPHTDDYDLSPLCLCRYLNEWW
jgi:hypothetical protein